MSATTVYTPLPDGLDTAPPGPELAALLWSVDPKACNGFQLLELARAQTRLANAVHGQSLATVHEIAHRLPSGPLEPPALRALPDCHADIEVGLALGLSAEAAASRLIAADVVARTPEFASAMAAGELDLPKMLMLGAHLLAVDPATVTAVARKIRPYLARQTIGQLRRRVRRLLLALVPEQAATRVARSEANRGVYLDDNPDGTAGLAGWNLPAVAATAAWARITAIATATHAAGDPRHRTLDQLRADVFLGLLTGADPADLATAPPAPRAGVIHVHVGLSTLAGLDDLPAELESYGPILADAARQTVDQLGDHARWRFAATDDDGQLVAEGPLRRPPRPVDRWGAASSASDTEPASTSPPDADPASSSPPDVDPAPVSRPDVDPASISPPDIDPVSISPPDIDLASRYRPTGAQRRFVIARDRTCRAPGCLRPARRCDIDHVRPWPAGPTTLTNLISLCRRHHRAKTVGRHAVRLTPYGLEWTTPLGRRYLSPPPPASAHPRR